MKKSNQRIGRVKFELGFILSVRISKSVPYGSSSSSDQRDARRRNQFIRSMLSVLVVPLVSCPVYLQLGIRLAEVGE